MSILSKDDMKKLIKCLECLTCKYLEKCEDGTINPANNQDGTCQTRERLENEHLYKNDNRTL